MTAPPPPAGDDRHEPLPGADGPDAPALDSLAAEEPAEPADSVAAPDDASGPDPADPPGPQGPGQPLLDSIAAKEPVPPAPAGVEPPVADAPRGSEGLTTAPPRPVPVGPPVQEAAVAEPPVAQPLEEPSLVAAVPPEAGRPDADAPPAEPTAPAASGTPSGRRGAWLPLTAAGLAVALLVGVTGWFAWQLRQQDAADTARVEAVAAARDAARLLFSYDHQTLQQDFERGLAVTTGDFRDQYQRTTRDVVTPVATKYKAVVLAEVVEAAVVDARADEVTALVFLNQATTSTRVQGQQVDQSRVRMRLVPRNGRWLVEEVTAL